jgi:hypothetical protein
MKKREKKTEGWQVLHVYSNQKTESEYEPTEEELLDQFASIVSDIYLKQYHGKKHDQEGGGVS